MYEIPSRHDVHKCLITAETIKHKTKPVLLTQTERPVDPQEAQTA